MGAEEVAEVGIVANPAASKDIRRLVARGRVIPDWEKVNIIRRALLGLQAAGVERVVAMPDSSHLCERAANEAGLELRLSLLEMPALYTEGDTVKAGALMTAMGVKCIVTLGGDGTNRALARSVSTIPVIPISTGTNNVFPTMTEGTLAGLVAGLIARNRIAFEWVSLPSKTLAVYVDGEYRDMALVDVAFSRERFTATRAIWDVATLYEVFLTRAEPASIGLSSVGARLQPLSLGEAGGLHYVVAGAGDKNVDSAPAVIEPAAMQVLAPIAPGVVATVPIARWNLISEGQRVPLSQRYSCVALDGERAFTVTPEQRVEVSVQRNGPPVVQIERALTIASEGGLFRW